MTASLPEAVTITGYLFVIPAICIFGIIGNILTLVVLIKGQFQGVAFMYLKGLALYDILGLLFIVPICVIRCPICQVSDAFTMAYVAYVYIPIGDIFLKASILTTVILTIERCIVVCFTTLTRLQTRRTTTALIIVVCAGVVCTLENLPTFWQVQITNAGDIEITDYGKSRAFLIYGWSDAVCFQFLPMVVLFIFNVILVLYLRSHQRRCRRQCLIGAGGGGDDENRRLEQRFEVEQTRIVFMLVGIIVLFLVTMVPSSAMQLVGYTLAYHTEAYLALRLVSTALTSLNFACNFLLYCTLNRRFWRTFKRIICCQGNKVHPETDNDNDNDERARADLHKKTANGKPSAKTSSNRSKDTQTNRPVSVSALPNTEIQAVGIQEESGA